MEINRFLNGQPVGENDLSGVPAGRAANEAVRNANVRKQNRKDGDTVEMTFPGRRGGGETMNTGNDVR